MKVCEICGAKLVRNDYYEKHMGNHRLGELQAVQAVEPEQIEPVVTPEPPKDQTILLKFKKPVEIIINGKVYSGSEIVAPSMEMASELVRIAREAYGISIL